MDAVFGLTNQFVAATALATGELGVETMAKHKEIESLSDVLALWTEGYLDCQQG